MTILIINGTAYPNPKGFIADGCHKIWLIRNETDMKDMRKAGWDDTDIRDIHDLPEVWADSCPLRFIETGTLEDIIPQGYETDEAHIQLVDDIIN